LIALDAPVVSIRSEAADYSHRPFAIADGASIPNLTISIAPGASVSGVVRPVPGLGEDQVCVVYFPEEAARRSSGATPPVGMGVVTARTDGLYETRPTLPPGRYFILAVAD